MNNQIRLIDLKKGSSCTVVAMDPSANELILRRIIQMGLSVGKKVKLAHKPFNLSGPIAIELDGNLLGLGQSEASTIYVSKD
jgi:Fe2+ transport system protein FeoA